jgi:hypothetical protein
VMRMRAEMLRSDGAQMRPERRLNTEPHSPDSAMGTTGTGYAPRSRRLLSVAPSDLRLPRGTDVLSGHARNAPIAVDFERNRTQLVGWRVRQVGTLVNAFDSSVRGCRNLKRRRDRLPQSRRRTTSNIGGSIMAERRRNTARRLADLYDRNVA